LRGKKLLDYGTAAGCMSLFAAKLDGMDVTSADLDTPYFALAKYRFNKYGVCTPLNLDQEQLPESAFDTVLLLDVLEHVVNWQKTLTDVTAALKNGGRLIVIVAYDLYPDGSLHICDRTGLTPETFTEWMLNHGYQFIEKSGNFSVYDLQKVS
jgi:cyclopropane fatty-acyl-phospholipid synthase-like methyltransferase